jgi:hypothetical protein
MPASCWSAVSCTVRSTVLHTSTVCVLQCKSLKTTHDVARLCSG